MLQDGLTNVISQLGLGGDKSAHGSYSYAPADQQQLTACYESSWVAQKAIDLPADDATSKWREWQGDKAGDIEAIERRIKLRETVNHALKQARLAGGSAIFIGTDRTTLAAPLQPDERIRFLNVIGRESISAPNTSTNQLTESNDPDHCLVDGQPVHKSRLAIFKGRHSSAEHFFGKSEISAAFDTIRNSDSVAANVATLVYEAKLDVYSIPELMAQDESRLMTRLSLIQKGKSIVNGIVLDKDEAYEQKQIQFSGLKDLLLASFQIVSGAVGIPASKLLGLSVSGLSATGDNEVRDYYDTVAGIQANTIRPAIQNIDNLMLNEAGADADCQWVSLWMPTAKEQADINSTNAQALSALAGVQVYTDDQIIEAGRQLMGDVLPALEDDQDVL